MRCEPVFSGVCKIGKVELLMTLFATIYIQKIEIEYDKGCNM
jgi:hypothetical protein